MEAREAAKKIEQEGGKIGKINIALSWSDGNDLDLHVTDPIYNVQIFYLNKVCQQCGAELDVDMRPYGNYDPLKKPIEHVYYNSVQPGKTYKIMVNLYSVYNGNTSSAYSLKIFTDKGKVVASWEGEVSMTKRSDDYAYTP
jgi:uncharacterized protein YfaP (DUF2135 family)